MPMQEKTFSIETYIYSFVDHLKDKAESCCTALFSRICPHLALNRVVRTEKTLLQRVDLISGYEILIARFKQRTPLTLKSIQETRHTMTNAKKRRIRASLYKILSVMLEPLRMTPSTISYLWHGKT